LKVSHFTPLKKGLWLVSWICSHSCLCGNTWN